tara:strand:+ start:29 stop:1273 length:1245 start_codon:yes stop_codon:yes gene_type:complete
MGNVKPKELSPFIFIPLLSLIFIRPFLSGLAYPLLEIYYQNCVILLAILSLFSYINHCEQGKIVFMRFSYALPILLFLSAYILSSIFSINPQNSIKETIKFISYVSIFYLVLQSGDKQKQSLVKVVILAGLLISIYAIYQYFWGYQHTLLYLKKIQSSFLLTSSYARDILVAKRAIGTFPSPNLLGGYLTIILFLTLHRFQRSRAYIILPITFALLLTKSLGAAISLILTLILASFFFYNSLKKRKLLLIALSIFIIIALIFITLSRWDRIIDLDNPQNSISQRLLYWKTASGIIKEHPVFGVGPGNFQDVFLQYKQGTGTDSRYAHNIFLHMWSETGILGVSGILYLIIIFLKKCAIKYEYRFISLGVIAFLLHNLIDNSYFIPQTGIFFWIMIAIVLSQVSDLAKKPHPIRS